MALDDVNVRGSRDWWFRKLTNDMFRPMGPGKPSRYQRLDALQKRFEGDPPLPEGAESAREVFKAFQRKSRTNFAELAVEAPRERMTPTAFRTAAAGDDDGDAEAAKIWAANQMPIEFADVLEHMLSMGDGYTITSPPGSGEDYSVITAEDPRQVITAHDPVRPMRVTAGLKLFHDDYLDQDVAYLHLPAGVTALDGTPTTCTTVHRATRTGTANTINARFRLSTKAWTWDPEPVELRQTKRVGITRYRNRHGVGEFELHVDILDRINHMLLQRMVIATLQAFRQRAVKGVPTHYPKGHPLEGQEVNYTDIFTADPGSLWLLPETAELWESGQVDLTPILSSVRDDVRDFATVTRTPFTYFNPDAANGSAEGASLQREGLVFKTGDRCTRAGIAAAQTMSLAFEMQGDQQRATPGALETIWAPVERFSLSERYDAAVKAKASGVPRATIWSDVLQFTPAQVKRMKDEAADDALLADAEAGPDGF